MIVIHDPYEINTNLTTKKKLEEKLRKSKKIKKKEKVNLSKLILT